MNAKQTMTAAHVKARELKGEFASYAEALAFCLRCAWSAAEATENGKMSFSTTDIPLAGLDDGELTALRDRVEAELAARAAARTAGPESQYCADIRNGCVDQEELGGYESHRRGKNWVATVVADKSQPGGLSRDFWAKASGSWRHLPADIKAGDVLEIAHEYTTGGGRCDKSRNYIKVVAVTESGLHFDDCGKPN